MAIEEAETSQNERGAHGGVVYDGFISYSHAADDLLAPRLQAGLQRFAKPWWKRRALRIFRDESSLSVGERHRCQPERCIGRYGGWRRIRMWSVVDHSLLFDVGFDGDNIRFVRFLDDSHLLLVPQVGSSVIAVVLDPEELADVGLARVARAFTETECLTYGIDPCPTTLEALRGG